MFEAQIVKGVDFLDKVIGEQWFEDIDLDHLNLGSQCNCVIGQLYEDYDFLYVKHENIGPNEAADMGFYLDTAGEDRYDTLTQEWKEKIAQLQSERLYHYQQEQDMQVLDQAIDPDGLGTEGQQAWTEYQKGSLDPRKKEF